MSISSPGGADGSWEARLRRLARFDLPILDDFALRPFTTSQGDDFHELVSERAGRGSFILTANRSPKDWYQLFPNAVVAEGVLDRLVNSSFHVQMEGKSYPGRSGGRDRAPSLSGEVRKSRRNSRDRVGHSLALGVGNYVTFDRSGPLSIYQPTRSDYSNKGSATYPHPCPKIAILLGNRIHFDKPSHNVRGGSANHIGETVNKAHRFTINVNRKHVSRQRDGRSPDHVRKEASTRQS